MHLHIAVHIAAGIPDAGKIFPQPFILTLRFFSVILQQFHQVGFDDVVLFELLAAAVHGFEVAVQVSMLRNLDAKENDPRQFFFELLHILLSCQLLAYDTSPLEQRLLDFILLGKLAHAV